MSNNYKNNRALQKGDAQAWIIAVLALIIIGLLGYVFWQNFIRTDNNKSADTSLNNSTESTSTDQEFNTYSAEDGYVKSFDYPSSWSIVNSSDICEIYNQCASAPIIALANNGKITLSVYGSQSVSESTIDEEAASTASYYNGEVVQGFATLDGKEARRINKSEGKITIVTPMRGGYGHIDIENSTDGEIDIILSTWKWL